MGFRYIAIQIRATIGQQNYRAASFRLGHPKQ
jgi:hypothetical protein